MIDETKNDDGKTRTIIVSPNNHYKISLMKIEGKFKSVDDVITYLLNNQKKNGKTK